MLAPDDPGKLEALRDDQGLEFPVLVDEGAKTVRAYGVLNEEMPRIPHPTALVIDKDGVVRYLRVDVDYKVRPPVAELLEALAELSED